MICTFCEIIRWPRVDVYDFLMSLGIDGHRIATVSFDLAVGLSSLCAYPCATKELCVSGIYGICSRGHKLGIVFI